MSNLIVLKVEADVKHKKNSLQFVQKHLLLLPMKSAKQKTKIVILFNWISIRKWSKKLGDKWRKGVPIEVLPIAYKLTKKEIERQLGGEVIVREGTEKVVNIIDSK
jgi:hypothetical protein